jgi:hypothetical protein
MGSVIPAGDSIPAMDHRSSLRKALPARHSRLNRLTKTIVMVAGFMLVGGSAVGGIAFAASRTSDSPSTHPQLTSSSGNRAGTDEGGNKQDSEHPTATPKTSGVCTADKDADDAANGEREGSPTMSRSPEADDLHHSATATGSDHPDAAEAPEATRTPEANETKEADDTGTGSSCDD